MTDTVNTVEWEQSGLLALAEDDGHGDTCGPIIMLDYMHLLQGYSLTYAALDTLRTRLIADKYMGADGSGMTMGNIVLAMGAYYGVYALKYFPWSVSQTTLNELHTDLVASLEAHQLVGMETHAAAKLPGNQPGIANHFILAGGFKYVNGVLFVLCCNGDSTRAITGGRTDPAQAPTWYSWDNLVAAQISSYAIWPAVEEPVLQIGQVSTYFTGAVDGPWQCGGHDIHGGILTFYRGYPVGGLQGFTVFGLPKSSEIALGSPKAGTTRQPTYQVFERGVLCYDPDRMLDNPPGAVGSIYTWHIDKAQVLAIIAPTPPPPAPVPPVNVKPEIDALIAALGQQAA